MAVLNSAGSSARNGHQVGRILRPSGRMAEAGPAACRAVVRKREHRMIAGNRRIRSANHAARTWVRVLRVCGGALAAAVLLCDEATAQTRSRLAGESARNCRQAGGDEIILLGVVPIISDPSFSESSSCAHSQGPPTDEGSSRRCGAFATRNLQ